MKNKKIILDLMATGVVFLVIGTYVLYFVPRPAVVKNDTHNSQNATSTPDFVYSNTTSDTIIVSLPYPGAVTGKTFSVLGKARGNWFFEASFPVIVLDKNGKVLTQTPAQAQGDWMTTNLVPFTADITIPASYSGPATILLKKDNPSGLSDKDASISFPITIEY